MESTTTMTSALLRGSNVEKSVEKFNKDLKEMRELVTNPEIDLYTRIPHGTGQNILREAILVADHNAYHLGQLVLLKKIYEAKN